MAVACDSNSLLALARCLECIPEGRRWSVVNSLLCTLANQGLPVGGGIGAQAANTALAGPTSGAAAAPTFRMVDVADYPPVVQPKIGVPFQECGSFVVTAALTYAANVVNTCLFLVSEGPVTINQVVYAQNNASVDGIAFAIYAVTPGSTTRGARLADTGPITTIAAAGPKSSPFLVPAVLTEGTYCLAYTNVGGIVQIAGISPGVGAPQTVLAAYNLCPEVYIGTAANPSVGGQMPATLGVITGVAGQHFPTCMLTD